MENIDWSDWIIAGSAFITAVATGVLAYITRRYVRLTREMLEASYKPEVVIRLLSKGTANIQVAATESTYGPIIGLSVKNVGSGIARKIEFEADFSFYPCVHRSGLRDIYFLVNGIDRLAPGEEKESGSDFVVNQSRDPNQLQTTIKGTWEDSKGKKHCEDFHLNFADPDLPRE